MDRTKEATHVYVQENATLPLSGQRNYDGNSHGKVKKGIGLMSKTITLHVHHAVLYVSLPSLHNYDVK